MAFDAAAQRYAMVDLDYDPDPIYGFSDTGALLMTTDWGEDIDMTSDFNRRTLLTGMFARRRRR